MILVYSSSMLLVTWLVLTFTPPEAEYTQAATELDTALNSITVAAPQEAIEAIEAALADVARFPGEVASDAETLDSLGRARMALVWLQLAQGNEQAAVAAMDEALRSAQGTALPSGAFGSKVKVLHEDRVLALKEGGTATLEVVCGAVDCQVVIDERRSANPSPPLYLGTYRVWIGGRGGEDWEYHEVELLEPGGFELVYTRGVVEGSAGLTPLSSSPAELSHPANTNMLVDTPSQSARARLVPIWAEALGVVLGVGGLVAGGVLLGLEGKCTNAAKPDGPGTCPSVWNVDPRAAYALFGAGGALLLGFGATLTIDEARTRRHKQAMLTWTIRF